MSQSIAVITLGVTDIDSAAEFYEGGFGLPRTDSGGGHVCLGLGRGPATLELCPWDELASEIGVPPESSGFRGFVLSYVVEQASDVDDMLVRLERAGGVVSKPPRFAFWGYSAHVTDPSGHLWKIASPKRKSLIGRKRAADGVPKAIPAQELALTIGVADIKRAKSFYEDDLGGKVKKDYSKFVSFEGDPGAPELSLYRWDALADDAGVPPEGSGFRGFRVGTASETRSASFTDPDGFFWKVARAHAQEPAA
jgi:catechol 2,3-dioxygenase-like lactoylglutathione lyase family enzyme